MSYWDKFRHRHEPNAHWEMRKRFLEAHKDSFDEDKLLCLTQTFYNVEFLGCRYPEKVMKEIEELSQGIADNHREAKKTKLQRTFVQASEAAESKVCRTGIKRKHEELVSSAAAMHGQTIQQVLHYEQGPPPQNTASGLDFRLVEMYLDRNYPLSQFILLRMNGETELTFEFLQRSARTSLVRALFQYTRCDGQTEGRLSIAQLNQQNAKEVAYATMASVGAKSFISKTEKQILRTKLLECADQMLCETQFCIVINNRFYSSQEDVEKEEEEDEEEANEEEAKLKEELARMEEKKKEESEKKKYISDEYEKLTENNLGSKLLRLMGWSGGGLGKAGQGISEPVPITGRMDNKRIGLGKEDALPVPKKGRKRGGPHAVLEGEDGEATMGLSVNRQEGLRGEQFKSWARELLSEYLHSANLLWFEDLIFSPTFTKEERAVFHQIVQKTKFYRDSLTCKSYGKNEARQMIIGRKATQNARTILRDLILCGNNPKFSLRVPEKFHTWCKENGYT